MGHIDRATDEVVVDEEKQIDVSGQFDGAAHFSWGRFIAYHNPGNNGNATTSARFRHRDILHRVTWRTKDTDRYISPTYGKPFHLVVQASREALQDKTGTWRRTDVSGNAPWILRLSSWALKEILHHQKGEVTPGELVGVALKVIAVVPCQLLLLAWPIGGSAKYASAFYKSIPMQSWDYPLYARNALDARPGFGPQLTSAEQRLLASKDQDRVLRPRRLVVWGDNGWQVETATADVPYLFISYTRRHWDPDVPETLAPLQKLARHLTRSAKLRAYWLDHQCIQPGIDMTEDIHTICDVVRGAEQVVVVVPSLDLDCIAVWGSRMWTVPEVLICQNNTIKFCTPDHAEMERSRIALAQGIWGNDQATRLLAEHFSGTLTLSRLELIHVGLKALSVRDTKALYSNGDLAYALMGLLNRRPQANFQDNQFQALARLSLANDSDRIVERMMCMLPPPVERDAHGQAMAATSEANRKFALEDELNANLWDIEPLCQVAGVCEGSALLLDGCRGASIRWKDIPAVYYVKRSSWRRELAAIALRSGPLWFIIGAAMSAFPWTRAPGVVILLVGLALLFSSPWTVIVLYGGKVWGATPWLVGLEGAMPLDKIEKFTFGNGIGRFSWAPSSSLLAHKTRDERLGAEPAWIRDASAPRPLLPPGHRIFTLIDTGTMTVHLFTAERPPTAAIVAGREGGMLRVILCSYDRSTSTFRKETVLRMETPMMDKATLMGWIKLA